MKIIGKLSTAETDINGKTEISHKSYHNPSRLDKSNAWFRFWYLTNINIIDGGWILLALPIEWKVRGSQYLKNGYTSKEKVIWAFTSLANIDKNLLIITLPTNSINNPMTQLPSYPLV